MLASINVNLNVYIEPNAVTWDIIKNHYSWKDRLELEMFIEGFKRDRVKTVNVRGKSLQLIEFQIWDRVRRSRRIPGCARNRDRACPGTCVHRIPP